MRNNRCVTQSEVTLEFRATNCTSPPQLHAEVSAYLNAAISDNTRRAYQADLQHFLSWGGAIPSTSNQIALYLTAFAKQHAIATLCRRMVSISKAHTSQGYLSPTNSDLVRTTLRGIRYTHGSAQRQVTPAIKEDILLMVAGLRGLKGIRDTALLLVGFAGAFRRNELASLLVSDIERAQQGLIVHLRRSKTDPEGKGRKVAIPYARGVVCPVIALQRWFDASGITEGAVFRGVNRHGYLSEASITPQSVALIVKERALAAGLDATKYSGHSLRAGLVTSAAKLGVPSYKIRAQTGHKSDTMLARYIRDANIFVDNAAGVVL